MKKISLYLALTGLIVLAVIPPIDFFITRPENDLWFVIVLMMGFFGFYTIWLRTTLWLKVIAVGSMGLCILSGSPLIAMTSYASILLCCYLYIFARKIEDWRPVYRFFQTLLWLNAFLVALQIAGKDTLLNFGRGHDLNTYGIIGQHMQMGSFSVVLAALLLPFNPWNMLFPVVIAFFCNSAWTLFVAIIGVTLLLWKKSPEMAQLILISGLSVFILVAILTDKIRENIGPNTGRLIVWKTSLQISAKHPWVGWGAGTYKVIYPAFSGQILYPDSKKDPNNIPYKTAHNWLVEMIFEMGYPFTLFILFIVLWTAWGLWKAQNMACLAGLIMIFLDGMVHFPDRMLQTVGVIIVFIAYCHWRLERAHNLKATGRPPDCHQSHSCP